MIFAYSCVDVHLWWWCASLRNLPFVAYSSATQKPTTFPCREKRHWVYALGAKYFRERLKRPNDTARVEDTGRHRIELNQGRLRSHEMPALDRAGVVHQRHVHSGLDNGNPEVLSS